MPCPLHHRISTVKSLQKCMQVLPCHIKVNNSIAWRSWSRSFSSTRNKSHLTSKHMAMVNVRWTRVSLVRSICGVWTWNMSFVMKIIIKIPIIWYDEIFQCYCILIKKNKNKKKIDKWNGRKNNDLDENMKWHVDVTNLLLSRT